MRSYGASEKLHPKDYSRRIRESLYEFLDGRGSQQLMLDDELDGAHAASPYLDIATQQMVWWLVDRIGEPGYRTLAEDLLSRRL